MCCLHFLSAPVLLFSSCVMSRLQLTLDDVEAAHDELGGELPAEDDVQFEMQPRAAPTKRKKTSVQSPSSSSSSSSSALFLSGLVSDSVPSSTLLPAADARLGSRRSHAALMFDRVQDRIAMKKFNAAQIKQQSDGRETDCGHEGDDSEADQHSDDEEEDDEEEDEEDDEESGGQSAEETDEADREEIEELKEEAEGGTESTSPPAGEKSAGRGSGGVHVVEWQGSKEELRRITDFSQLRLSKPLMRAVSELGYSRPTPVQSGVIPYAVAGRDILANSATGSGKTAAFMLPILERLFVRSNKRTAVTRVLVLLPTRELASQCMAMTEQLGKYADIRCALVVGGLSMAAQEQALRQRPDIVLATPGRLIDHMRNTASVHLDELEVLVLDEADRLLELGFVDELREIVKMCARQRQTMLFSATLSPSVHDLILLSLNQPVKVTIDPFDSVVERLTQEFVRIKQKASAEEERREREAIILALCQRSFKQRVLVFCQSKEECHRLFLLFSFFQLRAAELQGNLTQAQRMEALELFRSGAVHFLICTDLASRGLDIAGVSAVVNTSMPAQLRLYIHRVGRTARAGSSGRAVTLVGFHERKSVKSLMKRTTEAVHARVVPSDVVQKYKERVEQLQDDVEAVMEQERLDKAERVAEMEVNRARNTMLHEAEIKARPAKTWFQSQQEKMTSKAAAVHSFLPNNTEDGTEQQQEEAVDDRDRRRGKGRGEEKKDPLRGLSRAQKRRKLMRMEAEREAAQRLKEARAEDPTVSADDVRYMDPIEKAAKAGKAAKRRAMKEAHADADSTAPAAGSKKKTGVKRQRDAESGSVATKRKVMLMDEGAEDKRFKVKHVKGRVGEEPTKKRKPDKARKAFKSKGKHKRR